MSFRLATALSAAVTLALSVGASADPAQTRKPPPASTPAPAPTTQQSGTHSDGQWGQNLVRGGPLYNGQDYLGTDPDPNIRFQILRDLTGRYGGGGT